MNDNHFLKNLLILFFLVGFVSCETDDVAPALVDFSASDNDFSEAGGSVDITASLNTPATATVVLDLVFTGTATIDVDYTTSSNQITIPAGSLSGSITLNGIQDDLVEGPENVEISISAVTNAVAASDFNLVISILDDDTDTDGDGVLDANDDCPLVPGDPANNGCPFLGFIINEVLYDPANGTVEGDANGDGVRSPLDDEFVEFFNSGPALDISGYMVYDTQGFSTSTPRHIFPPGTIVPMNKAIVLFGGGNPTGSFGGSATQTASSGQLNLNNAGDELIVTDAMGNMILSFDINPLSGNPNESYTRDPDLTGDFVQHSSISAANGALFSPGTKLDGSSF